MRKNFFARILCAVLAIIMVTPCAGVSAEEEHTVCAVLIEASSGVVITGQNEDTPVPAGTMAKLMTVLLAAESVERGELTLEQKLKTSAYANSMQGAQVWLMPGEEITVEELFKSVMIGNANDASVVLAEGVSGTEESFVKLMNSRAGELGMTNTIFTNCNGYYDDGKQISTAHDLAILCAKLAEYDFLRGYFSAWRDFVRNGQTELVNANEAVKSYKGIIGFKAGYTERAGHFAAFGAERDGVTYIAVVLGYSDKDECQAEAKRLLNLGFSSYQVVTPELPKDIPAEIAVRGGMAGTVPVECGAVRNVVLPNGAAGSVTSRVVVTDYVYAPAPAGKKVGEVQFLRDGKMMFAVDICTTEPVEEMTTWKALCKIIKKLLTF